MLRSAGQIAYALSDLRRGKELLTQALEIYRQSGDERNTAWSMTYLSGNFMVAPHKYPQGIALCTQALELFRKLEDKSGIAVALTILGELARMQGNYEAAQRYYEEGLSLAIETGERQREAMLLNNLSFVAYHHQDYQLALRFSQSSLIVAQEINSEFRQTCFLATVAGPLVALGQPEQAARLLGATQSRYEKLGVRHHPADQPELDIYEASARKQLGDQAFREAWQAGQTLTLEEAVSLALTELDLEELNHSQLAKR